MATYRERGGEAWDKAWSAYQAEAKRQRARYEKAARSADTRIRDMAEACGFDRDMPLHTAHNWYKQNPECAERMFALDRKVSRINCERENALSRTWNKLLAGPHGLAQSTMQDCRRAYPKNRKHFGTES
jgi:hypothetical protein